MLFATRVVGTLGTVLAALYILIMYQRTMTGPTSEIRAATRRLSCETT